MPIAEFEEQAEIEWGEGPPTQENAVEFLGINSFIATDFPGNSAKFDLNGDGSVNSADLNQFVESPDKLKNTYLRSPLPKTTRNQLLERYSTKVALPIMHRDS